MTHIQVQIQKKKGGGGCLLNAHQSYKTAIAGSFSCVATMHLWTTVDKNFILNWQFMILTYMWPWNKVKVTKPGMNSQTRSKVIVTQSGKDLP